MLWRSSGYPDRPLLPIKDDIPTRRFPIVTVVIIAINVIVFFGFQVNTLSLDGADLKQDVVTKYAAVPYEITHPGKQCGATAVVRGVEVADNDGQLICQGQTIDGVKIETVSPSDQPAAWLTVFFAMFMHGGLLHIAFNMLFLWIFGNNIEDAMNRGLFVAFYLLGGVVAMLAQTVFDPTSTVPTLGASGAIAAVLGAYALLYPRARVLTLVIIIFFVTILRLPALVVLGLWFLLQLLDFSSTQPTSGGGGGVAYLAHIGGFLFGLAAIRLFATNVYDDYERSHRLPVY
jgi:membrane associated rhomboid family serine protease